MSVARNHLFVRAENEASLDGIFAYVMEREGPGWCPKRHFPYDKSSSEEALLPPATAAPGPGTYLCQGFIYASTVGWLKEAEAVLEPATHASLQLQCVTPPKDAFASQLVLAVGQIVLCRVVRLYIASRTVVGCHPCSFDGKWNLYEPL